MLLFDHQKMPSQEALVVNLPPYKEWAGFKWLLQECSLSTTLPLLPSPSYKTSQRTLYSTCASPKSLTRLWNFRNADQWRPERRSKQWLCGGKHAASQKSERPPLLHRLLHSFAHSRFCLLKLFVRGGTKKDMGVKSAIELYNPVLLFQLFPSDNFQAIEPNQLRALHPPVLFTLFDPSKSI